MGDSEKYRSSNIFLADINNEKVINETYKENLGKLWNFVMAKFTEDTMVYPKETEWFGFYDDGQAESVHTLEESDLYTEDRLGLKKMKEEGRLVKYSIEGDHLKVSETVLVDIIEKFIVYRD